MNLYYNGLKHVVTPNAVEMVEKLHHSYIVDGNLKQHNHSEKVGSFLKLNILSM